MMGPDDDLVPGEELVPDEKTLEHVKVLMAERLSNFALCAECGHTYWRPFGHSRCAVVTPYYLAHEMPEHFAHEEPRVVRFWQFGNTGGLLFWTDCIVLEKKLGEIFAIQGGEVDGVEMVLTKTSGELDRQTYKIRPPINQRSGSKASITVKCLKPPSDFRALLVSKVAAESRVRDLEAAFVSDP